jgi:hypothetical protein
MTTQTIGSRRQVWNGTAKKTSGGLTKSELMMSHGRIVSKSKHFSAKKEMRLLKYGYGTKKGKFGYVKIGSRKHRKGSRSRKMRGGMSTSLSPADVNGSYMIKDVVSQPFSPLDRALVGGSGMAASAEPGSALWAGDSSPLDRALMAGGRRHRRRHRKMRGGTTSHRSLLMPASVTERALLA